MWKQQISTVGWHQSNWWWYVICYQSFHYPQSIIGLDTRAVAMLMGPLRKFCNLPSKEIFVLIEKFYLFSNNWKFQLRWAAHFKARICRAKLFLVLVSGTVKFSGLSTSITFVPFLSVGLTLCELTKNSMIKSVARIPVTQKSTCELKKYLIIKFHTWVFSTKLLFQKCWI